MCDHIVPAEYEKDAELLKGLTNCSILWDTTSEYNNLCGTTIIYSEKTIDNLEGLQQFIASCDSNTNQCWNIITMYSVRPGIQTVCWTGEYYDRIWNEGIDWAHDYRYMIEGEKTDKRTKGYYLMTEYYENPATIPSSEFMPDAGGSGVIPKELFLYIDG